MNVPQIWLDEINRGTPFGIKAARAIAAAEARPTKPQVEKARQAPPDQRPGTVLHRLLKARYGVRISACTCQEWINKMNVWGPSGCRENMAEIVDHLFDEASTNPQVSLVIRLKLAVPIIGAWEGKRQLRNLVTEAIEFSEKASVHNG